MLPRVKHAARSAKSPHSSATKKTGLTGHMQPSAARNKNHVARTQGQWPTKDSTNIPIVYTKDTPKLQYVFIDPSRGQNGRVSGKISTAVSFSITRPHQVIFYQVYR